MAAEVLVEHLYELSATAWCCDAAQHEFQS